LPPALTEQQPWVVWQFRSSDGVGLRKVPVDPSTGAWASVTDARIRFTFDEAVARATRLVAGVGLVLDPSHGLVVIDVENAFDEKGKLARSFRRWLDEVDTYAERSIGGTGVHVVAYGSAEAGHAAVLRLGSSADSRLLRFGTFAVVTGARLPSVPRTVRALQPHNDALDNSQQQGWNRG
jgi:putative DNA primase/helicase